MSVVAPVTASSREPAKPRRVPRHIRHLVEIMVRGREDDPDCAPLAFVEAAAIAGVAPDVARRWLDRGEVRALLRAERRAFRDAICAGNELALQRIRDGSANAMAQLGAVRVLENISEEAADRSARGHGAVSAPGLVIVIERSDRLPAPLGPVVDVTPAAELEPVPEHPRPPVAALRQPPRR